MLSSSLILVLIPRLSSAIEKEEHIGRIANPHRKALASTPRGSSRFMDDAIQSSPSATVAASLIPTAVGSTNRANFAQKGDEEHDDDGDEEEESWEWESSSTGAPTATISIASPTQSTNIWTLDPSTAPPTTTASVATSTETTTHATDTPITIKPTTTVSFVTSTESPPHVEWTTYAPMTMYPATPPSTTAHPTNWVSDAPISSFPTHPPTPAVIVTTAPPTYFPSYSPTIAPAPQSSEPTTIKPTPFPSQEPVVLASPPYAQVATYAPSTSEPSYPTTPTFVTHSPSTAAPSVSTIAPSQNSIIVEGILTFQLNLDRVMEGNVAAFESVAEDFLRDHLSSRLAQDYNSALLFSSFDVTVASQTLVRHEKPSPNTNVEPARHRKLGGSATLFVVATVTAIGSPADVAAEFPFQTAISVILSEKNDEFSNTLFSSDAFKGMQTLNNVELTGSDGGIKKPLVFGCSIGGIVALFLLAGACFAVQRRHERKTVRKSEKVASCIVSSAGWEVDEEVGDCELSRPNNDFSFNSTKFPDTVPPFCDEEGNDLSSLEDSLNPNNPETISHEGSDLSSLDASSLKDNYSKIISHEDSDSSSEDSKLENLQNVSREELSCLEDSLNPGIYPQNMPHFPFSFDGDVSINISAELEQQGDEWSLEDNFPPMQTENGMISYKMNHSYMTDSDESSTTLSIASADLEDSLLSFVENACTVNTDQEGRSVQSYVGTVDADLPSPRNALKLAGKSRK